MAEPTTLTDYGEGIATDEVAINPLLRKTSFKKPRSPARSPSMKRANTVDIITDAEASQSGYGDLLTPDHVLPVSPVSPGAVSRSRTVGGGEVRPERTIRKLQAELSEIQDKTAGLERKLKISESQNQSLLEELDDWRK
ncbi:hypothetical protein HK102_006190, partial [Quaeritorhiza haematococci]